FLWFLISNEKVLEVSYTKTPPIIDGFIEGVWQNGDSAYGFIQFRPNEGASASEPTIVYVVADDDNLYFAFKCFTPGRQPVASFSGFEDQILLYLDTFDNKTNAYYFNLCLSGLYLDGILLDDGKNNDVSWDGVFYFKARQYKERYEIELKIPFRAIRFKKGLKEWGINIARWCVKNYEISYWAPVRQKDGLQVSKFGRLININPKSAGYYFELYPEGFIRYDKTEMQEQFKPRASLNLKWDITSQTTLNATMFPDFAQIESDPYTLNLAFYPIRLSERRPFFIEGSDIFKMPSLGQGFFKPLEIFYSRRIGKSLPDGELVPMLGGVKFLKKEKRWNWGMLGALTGRIDTIPEQGFGVLRIRHSIFKNSEIGMILSGTVTNKENYNSALEIDGVYRKGPSQFTFQSALSDRNGEIGWGVSTGGLYLTQNFGVQGSFLGITDLFDVSEIGYVPWTGMKKFYIGVGPRHFFKTGIINNIFLKPSTTLLKESGGYNWSKIFGFSIDTQLRNLWGFSFTMENGKKFEADTSYTYYGVNTSVSSGHHQKFRSSFGCSYAYCYNYHQNWLAPQFSTWFSGALFPISPVSVSLSTDFIVEWNPEGIIALITPYATPRIDFTITPTMTFGIFNEFVFNTPDTDFEKTKILSNRFGFLFSYNFKPKSWLYIALNDYRVKNEMDKLILKNQVGAIKAKYLIYF
ncbi:MAG: DUF5916 domain-containing protein, partial [bacterium]